MGFGSGVWVGSGFSPDADNVGEMTWVGAGGVVGAMVAICRTVVAVNCSAFWFLSPWVTVANESLIPGNENKARKRQTAMMDVTSRAYKMSFTR